MNKQNTVTPGKVYKQFIIHKSELKVGSEKEACEHASLFMDNYDNFRKDEIKHIA